MAYSRVGDCDQEGRLLPKLEGDAICLLCLSRYYPHKNFEVLLEVATAVRDRGLPYRLITTIDPSQHRNAATFLSNVKSLSLERYLINIGPVPIERVDRLYGEVDGLLLPTLLESFSATYADCLHKGIPIFTSDRDFARDACGDCAFYFDPLNARSIVSTIESGFGNPQALYEVVQRGRRRIQRLPGWDRVCQQYIDSLKSIV